MLRRSLFVSALMVSGIVGFASNAKAETATQNITFSANVSAACNISAPNTGITQGQLAFPNGATDQKKLVTTTPTKIGVDCVGGKLSVSSPILSTKPANFTGELTNTAKVTSSGGKTANVGTDSEALVEADKGDATVEMTSTNTEPFVAGQYVYTVTVTATK